MHLRNHSLSYEQLTAAAQRKKSRVASVKKEFLSLQSELKHFAKEGHLVNQALVNLTKSAQYCKLYYSAENSDQEVVRENIVRSKATEAVALLKKAKRSTEE